MFDSLVDGVPERPSDARPSFVRRVRGGGVMPDFMCVGEVN